MPGKTELKSRIDRIKKTNRIEDVITRYLRIEKNGKGYKTLCPVHDDTDPSFYVYPDSQSYHCFGCEAHGDVIDFITIIEKCTKSDAVGILEGIGNRDTGLAKDVKTGYLNPNPKSLIPKATTAFKQLIAFYQGNLAKNSEAQSYLRSRSLFDPELVKHFNIGYCSGGARKLLPDDPELIEGLKGMGLLNDRGNESFYTCITIPIYDTQGVPVGLYGRSIHQKRHLYLKGEHKGILNWQALKVYKEIILTESIIDALSAWRLSVKNVIPLYGTNGLTQAHLALFAEYRPEEIILLLDNDDAGRRAINSLLDKLAPLGCRVSKAELPEQIKDVNDYLTSGQSELQSFIDKRVTIQDPSPITHDLAAVVQTGDEMTFESSGATWIVKGLKTISATSMRVILVVQSGDQFYSDRVDLYSHRSRKGCARALESELGLPGPTSEKTLIDILKFIQEMTNKKETTDEPEEVILSDDERAEAIDFLKQDNLLDRVSTDLDTLGYTGEAKNKKLCYLVATSRRLDSPLSCMIRSQSGAGKSLLMERVAALMPEEDIFLLSRISTQGLYYMPKDSLCHKLLIIDERRGSEEADYSIRSLQSRKKLNLAVVMKNPSTGKQQTQFFEIHGPIAYMDSSTEMEANPENENRCFVIYLDESRDQTQAILKAQQRSRTLQGITDADDRNTITRIHQNAQRVLRPLKVIIPYADKIEFPLSWLRVRRDHERFLSLIEASAYLNQYQRPVRNAGGSQYIEATIDDYRIAYDLARDILQSRIAYDLAHDILNSTLSELSKHSRDILRIIEQTVKEKADVQSIHVEKVTFTRREIRDRAKIQDYIIRDAMKDLHTYEYINIVSIGRGGRHIYSINARDDKNTTLTLTPPEALFEEVVEVKRK